MRERLTTLRRQQAASAALKILAEEGWEGLNIRKVSEKSGISMGALSHFVGRKRDMVVEAISYGYGLYIDTSELTPSTNGDNSIVTLRHWVSRLFNDRGEEEWAFYLAVWARLPFDAEIRAGFSHTEALYCHMVARVVEGAQAEGKIDPGLDPSNCAILLVLLCRGLAIRVFSNHDRNAEARVAISICNSCIDSLLIKSAPISTSAKSKKK